jgi:prophage tail gpP-like protein
LEKNKSYHISDVKNWQYSRSVISPKSTLSFEIPKNSNIQEDYDEIISAIKPGMEIFAFVDSDDDILFLGYITEISKSISAVNDSIKISCQDIIWRLESTSINPYRQGITTTMTIPQIVDWAMQEFKGYDKNGKINKSYEQNDLIQDVRINYGNVGAIKDIRKTQAHDWQSDLKGIKKNEIKPKENETVYSFISRILKPHGYIFQVGNSGDLNIYRPNVIYDENENKLFMNFNYSEYEIDGIINILNANLDVDVDNIPKNVMVYGKRLVNNANYGGRVFANIQNDRIPDAILYNHLIIVDNEINSKDEAEKLAKRKISYSIAQNYIYDFEIPLIYDEFDGKLIWNDVIVHIRDEYNDIDDLMYVLGIDYYSNETEQKCKIKCTLTNSLLFE